MVYLCLSTGRHGKGGHHNNTKGGLKSTMKFFKHHGKMHMKSAYKAMGAPKRCVSHLNQSFRICFLKGSSILDLACVVINVIVFAEMTIYSLKKKKLYPIFHYDETVFVIDRKNFRDNQIFAQ